MKFKASLLGAFFAGSTVALLMGLPSRKIYGLLAVLLGVLAGIYLGAAFATGRATPKLTEGAAVLVFSALAVWGIWRSPLYLAAGYLAHGLWNLAHHRKEARMGIPAWWPPFCLVYDWVIAGAIFLLWLKG